MTITRRKALLGFSAGLALTLLAGCMTPADTVRYAAPTPCTDSVYAGLKHQHSDSLSEREMQRLESLGRECADARISESNAETTTHTGWMGIRHGAGVGIMAAVMLAMMVTMW
ncbi:MAG TPA: hypothetical protein VFZ24_10295 [Longimicrobiales bacterium]